MLAYICYLSLHIRPTYIPPRSVVVARGIFHIKHGQHVTQGPHLPPSNFYSARLSSPVIYYMLCSFCYLPEGCFLGSRGKAVPTQTWICR